MLRRILRHFYVGALLMGTFWAAGCSTSPDDGRREWRSYLGDPASSQFSILDQINRDNVSQLEIAWVYRTGDARSDNRSQIQCNPLIVGGMLYATSPGLKLFALDASSGEPAWVFDPFEGAEGVDSLGVNRGVVYWRDARGGEARILYTASHYLYSIDVETGRPDPGFGEAGRVDLKLGLDRDIGDMFINSNTPGIAYKDLIILGSRVSEGPGPSAPGHIRAFNVRTGKREWIFHTIPHPGEPGYETWPADAWERSGGANSWSGMSLDHGRGIVYIPTGSPAFDFYGGDRHGQNLYGNCVLALKAETGELVWYYQLVHHDLWDRDPPAPPNLVTVNHDGQMKDAVAQITKSGHVFLLDRDTGEPLFPVEEIPVQRSDLKGEASWPTQPLPVKPPPFVRQRFNEEDITDISPESHDEIRKRFTGLRTGEPFIPPSQEGTIIFPGFDGGGEWGGAAFDPESGLLYVNGNEMAWILTMVDVAERRKAAHSLGESVYAVNCAVCHGPEQEGDAQNTYPNLLSLHERFTSESLREVIESGKGFMPGFKHLPQDEKQSLVAFLLGDTGAGEDAAEGGSNVVYSMTGYNRFLDQHGYPAVKPPWGTLNAIDLNAGEIRWTTTLGEFPELAAKGIAPTGTENYGGPVVTAGGLIFIAASKDEKFRAFDKQTGKVLWETVLPAGGYATPATYEVGGKQYVVIAAGGGKMGTKSGDFYVAFRLP